MSITSKQGIHPEKIPPTADAASLHDFYCVYIQAVYWKALMRTDIDATRRRWRVKGEKLEPTDHIDDCKPN